MKDKELLVMSQVLLQIFQEELENGKIATFPPDKIVFSEDIEAEDDFSFEIEVKEIEEEEGLKLLGATLYHLVKGESEWNDISYILDYSEIKSQFWGILTKMLNKETEGAVKIKEELDSLEINGDESVIEIISEKNLIQEENDQKPPLVNEVDSLENELESHSSLHRGDNRGLSSDEGCSRETEFQEIGFQEEVSGGDINGLMRIKPGLSEAEYVIIYNIWIDLVIDIGGGRYQDASGEQLYSMVRISYAEMTGGSNIPLTLNEFCRYVVS